MKMSNCNNPHIYGFKGGGHVSIKSTYLDVLFNTVSDALSTLGGFKRDHRIARVSQLVIALNNK